MAKYETPRTSAELVPDPTPRIHPRGRPDEDARAICHHSGEYLSRTEYMATRMRASLSSFSLKERHDFPGFEALDARFLEAGHAVGHDHVEWSRPGIRGIAGLLSALVLAPLALAVLTRRDFVAATPVELGAFIGLPIFLLALAALLAARGAWLVARRRTMYHADARRRRAMPTTRVFPLQADYRIEARESAQATLGNGPMRQASVRLNKAQIDVTVMPLASSAQQFAEYRARYPDPHYGAVAHAGRIGLSDMGGVVPDGANWLEDGHRLALNFEVPQGLPSTPMRLGFPYAIRPDALFTPSRHVSKDALGRTFSLGIGDERRRFVMECAPQFDPQDSRKLVFVWKWLGDPRLRWTLDEFQIDLGDAHELGEVEFVDRGRFDTESRHLIWRNLAFYQDTLRLSVNFSRPIVESRPELHGTYRLRANGLMSGLDVSATHLWDARGLQPDTNVVVRCSSELSGDAVFITRLLSHQHEVVEYALLSSATAPDLRLVGRVTRALVKGGVGVQRVEQARPHADPATESETQVAYWDLHGRCYGATFMDPIDAHVVVAGYQPLRASTGTPDVRGGTTQIELRLRGLHDPRNTAMKAQTRHKMQALKDSLLAELKKDDPAAREVESSVASAR
jgi:hypothetical protein